MEVRVTENPPWINDFIGEITEHEMTTIDNPAFHQVFKGRLNLDQLRQIMVDFYPLVETFPRYMELILPKIPVEDSYRCQMARSWLIRAIDQKRRQAKQYRDWMRGFGAERGLALSGHCPSPEVDAVNNFLWKVCTYGTLAEATAALNFTIERLTRIWSIRILEHLDRFKASAGVELNKKTLAWLSGNANCHDHYPEEALEVIKAFATSLEERNRVVHASQHALAYYTMAADASYYGIRSIHETAVAC